MSNEKMEAERKLYGQLELLWPVQLLYVIQMRPSYGPLTKLRANFDGGRKSSK